MGALDIYVHFNELSSLNCFLVAYSNVPIIAIRLFRGSALILVHCVFLEQSSSSLVNIHT